MPNQIRQIGIRLIVAAAMLAAAVTLGRVLLTLLIATLWALPVGVTLGLSPRLARWAN